MNVVDTSGWIEYFGEGPNAAFFAPIVENTDELVVPVVILAEVFKRVLQSHGDGAALKAIAAMQRGQVVNLDSTTAMSAAHLSLRHQIPLIDSIVLAAARAEGATLWTQDPHFEGILGVRFLEASRDLA
ncbi:type II toxin-antitoxin system VapC family toxin [Candidatus Fermentibacteria bacterium]|nr:type II toxin-antitoxin system VapC family toxin [Candidatus Fermentibacteria bacterium]